jgi:hypothetical protein
VSIGWESDKSQAGVGQESDGSRVRLIESAVESRSGVGRESDNSRAGIRHQSGGSRSS